MEEFFGQYGLYLFVGLMGLGAFGLFLYDEKKNSGAGLTTFVAATAMFLVALVAMFLVYRAGPPLGDPAWDASPWCECQYLVLPLVGPLLFLSICGVVTFIWLCAKARKFVSL